MERNVQDSYEILTKIDDMFSHSRFSEVDSLLRGLNLEELTDTQLVSYLCTSRHAKNKLPYRSEFYERVKGVLENRGKYTKPLLHGLE